MKPGGVVAIAGAGLTREIDDSVPEHLREWWEAPHWCLHSADWWRRHWQRSGILDVQLADAMPEGWELWLDWQRAVSPDNAPEIAALGADAGRWPTHVRAVGRRTGLALEDPIVTVPSGYTQRPLLRDHTA